MMAQLYGLRTNPSNGSSSDRIDHGVLSGVDWTTFSVVGWWMPLAVSLTIRGLWSKGTSGGARLLCSQSNATSGAVRVLWVRATTNLQYASTANVLVPNKRICVAVTGDKNAAAGSIVRIYVGDEHAPLREVSYSLQTNGAGAFSSIAAHPFRMSCNEVPDVAFCGIVWQGAVAENRLLPLEQMDQLRRDYHAGRSMGLSLLARYGATGIGPVTDDTGHGYRGTITGATPTMDILPIVGRRDAHELRRRSWDVGAASRSLMWWEQYGLAANL